MSKQYLINDSGIVLFSRSKGFVTIPRTLHYYDRLYAELMDDAVSEEQFLADIDKYAACDVLTDSKGALRNEGDHFVFIDGDKQLKMPRSIYDKARELASRGASYDHLRNFWRRCLCNPNPGSVQQLFEFVSRHLLTITNEGMFVAYKGVDDNYYDLHSHTFDNHPGRVIEMPREQVTYDPQQTCSAGLHVANYHYASGWGRRVVVVLVDPADVVSVPCDSNAEKIRVCRYTVQADYVPEFDFKDTAVVDKDLKAQKSYTLAAERPWTDEEDRLVLGFIASGRMDVESLASKLRRSVDSVVRQIAFLKEQESRKFDYVAQEDESEEYEPEGCCYGDCAGCDYRDKCDVADYYEDDDDDKDFCDEDEEREFLDSDLDDDDEPAHVTVIVSRLSDAQVKSLQRLYKKFGKQWVTIAKAMGLPKSEADYLRKLVKRLESLGVIR